jgi:hypothetical protein
MVEKHKMIADFEQLTYTPEMLREVWDNKVKSFQDLISGGWTNEYVLDFINYIRTTEYANIFFPGSSLGTLLISKPTNGKLNYQQTLAISVENEKIKLKYSDWDAIDTPDDWKKTVLWIAECHGRELKVKFLEFIEWNTNWRLNVYASLG